MQEERNNFGRARMRRKKCCIISLEFSSKRKGLAGYRREGKKDLARKVLPLHGHALVNYVGT